MSDILKEESTRFQQLFMNNPMPMWIIDYDSKAFLEVNKRALRVYGFTRKEFLSMTIRDIRPAEDVHELDNIHFADTYSGIWRHYKQNRALMHVEVFSQQIQFRGRRASLVLINDITHRIQAEERNAFERRDKEALINSTQDFLWSIGPEYELIAANKAFLDNIREISGKSLQPGDDILKMPLPADYVQRWKEFYRRGLSGESFRETIYRPPLRSQEAQWLDVRFNPILDNKVVTGLACFGSIVTEHKRKEEALKLSNERYNLVSRATSDMVWDCDLLTGRVYRNSEGWKKIFGAEDMVSEYGTYEDWSKRVHPDDESKLTDTLENLERMPDMQFFEVECRVSNKDGRYRYVLDRGYVIRNDMGKPVRLIGATQDITDKKEAQHQLSLADKRKQQEIATAVIVAQENERRELGIELHDNINQILSSARLYLSVVQEQISDVSYRDKVDTLIGQAIEEIRTLTHSLIPPTLGKTSCKEALSVILETARKTTGVTVYKDFKRFNERGLSDNLKLAIYRIAQEQLNNIHKYASASAVYVKVVQQANLLTLNIKDDGVGFDVSAKTDGIGLMNIRTRASLFNGHVDINTSPGNGCELQVTFCLEA